MMSDLKKNQVKAESFNYQENKRSIFCSYRDF